VKLSKRKDLQIISNIIKAKSKVLDLGCGDGELLHELILEKNIKGLGIEISLERIKSCIDKGVSVVQEDLNEGLKEFQDNSFDYVILSQTLEYISKPDYLIKEMLRAGGYCIISFENLAYWKNRISFLLKGHLKSGEKIDALTNGKKQQILTIKSFLNFCTKNNLKISEKFYLPKRKLNLAWSFPNTFCRTAVFILKSDKN